LHIAFCCLGFLYRIVHGINKFKQCINNFLSKFETRKNIEKGIYNKEFKEVENGVESPLI